MLNGHNAGSVVREGKQLLSNYTNTSSRTARRFLSRYLTNSAGAAVLEVCLAPNTGSKLTPEQYQELQVCAEENHNRFFNCQGQFILYSLAPITQVDFPTKGSVTYTYLIKENLEKASTETYRNVVQDIVRLLENIHDFDDDPVLALQKVRENRENRISAEIERNQRLEKALDRMFV